VASVGPDGQSSSSEDTYTQWSGSASSVEAWTDGGPIPTTWQERKAEERARTARVMPLRAEDEILRVRYFDLKKRVADLEAKELQRCLTEGKHCGRQGARRESSGTINSRLAQDVWFTTLAEVSVNPVGTPTKAAGDCADDLDRLVEKLFADALEDGTEVCPRTQRFNVEDAATSPKLPSVEAWVFGEEVR
jgi:hypothetical protein